MADEQTPSDDPRDPRDADRPSGPTPPPGSGPDEVGDDQPSPRRSPLIATLVVLALLTAALTALAGFWTEVLWYDSVNFSGVFRTQIVAKILLGLVGGVIVGGLTFSSLYLALRNRPIHVPTPQTQVLEHYQALLEPLRRTALIAIPIAVGLFGGLAASAQWDTAMMWLNRTPFGVADPEFGKDMGFFIFELPWWQFVVAFLTTALVIAILAAAFVHYLYGALVVAGPERATTPFARIHLSILIAALLLVRAAAFWFERYSLALNTSPRMTGIQYADAHASIPAKSILTVAAVMAALLCLSALWMRTWRLPIIGIVALVTTSIVVGGIFPAAVQSLQVKPSENQLELPYLKRNMTATLAAYGVDQVDVTPNYSAVTTASPEQLRKDAASIPGIRIIDPNVVSPTFKQQQAQRVYYAMPDPLDVDRYTIKGEERDAVVAVRELDLSGMPAGQRNWLNDHTVNTHGYGFVAAFGNTKNSDGSPRYFEANVPSTGDLGAYEPRIYYGEKSPDYSVVGGPAGTPPAEFDYLDDSASSQAKTTYAGKGGVSLGGLGKFAYAIKYREINFLLSEAVNSDSKILENRSPRDRVAKIAPWLTLDGNVYPAVVDKKVVWIVDGYTTSANYPNSQMSQFGQATADSVTARGSANVQAVDTGQVNYIRNSVKATVDAYDGTVHLYAWDATDPVLQTWSKIFPGTVEPMSNISADLMSHLRYPEDLFKVQRDVLSKYHVTDPTAFYGGQDFWRVPDDPTRAGTGEMPPYYLSIQMPGQAEPKFSLTTSFMPNGDRQILSGFLAVDGDAGKLKGERSADYGKLRLLVLAKGSSVTGPGQVYNEMRNSAAGTKDPALPQALGLGQYINNANSSSGAHAIFGNQLTVPIAKGLLYVQPLYLQAQNSYPLLNVIVVSFGNKIAWASTLEGALDQLFGGAVTTTPPTTGTPTTPPTSGTPTSGATTPTGSATGDPAALKQALADAQTAYNDGQEALKRGDFTAYGDSQKRLKEALDRAVRASPQGGSITLTP